MAKGRQRIQQPVIPKYKGQGKWPRFEESWDKRFGSKRWGPAEKRKLPETPGETYKKDRQALDRKMGPDKPSGIKLED